MKSGSNEARHEDGGAVLPNSALWIPDLTFVIFTFNEEARLPNIIKNVRAYGRILVVDNYSSDQTVEIAHAQGCDVLMNKNNGWVEDEETTGKIKAYVQTEWLYWGFADEILSKEALADIARVITQGQADVISILRRNYFYGELCHDVAIAHLTKVFKKSAIDFRDNTIHNFGRTLVGDDRVYKMPPEKFIHHLIGNTTASYLNTVNRYTDLEITTKPAAEMNKPVFYFLFLPIKTIWQDYFVKGGRKAGRPGLALSVLMLIYLLTKALKGYEALCRMDAAWIAQKNQDTVNELLRNFP